MEKINATRLEELKAEILDSRKDQKTCITVCGGTGCHAYGCLQIADAFRDEVKKQKLKATTRWNFLSESKA
jgi:NADH-quinone oxidoreductase subunit F